MIYDVYKSLDKVSSLFGLKGSYIQYAAFAVGGCAIVGFLVAQALNGLVGVLVFIGAAAVSYFTILGIQAKYSERERTKWFCSHRLPNFIVVPPVRMRRFVKLHFGVKGSPRMGKTYDLTRSILKTDKNKSL